MKSFPKWAFVLAAAGGVAGVFASPYVLSNNAFFDGAVTVSGGLLNVGPSGIATDGGVQIKQASGSAGATLTYSSSALQCDTAVTITPGPLQVGLQGISTDGGIYTSKSLSIADPTRAGTCVITADTNGQPTIASKGWDAANYQASSSGVFAFYAYGSPTYTLLGTGILSNTGASSLGSAQVIPLVGGANEFAPVVRGNYTTQQAIEFGIATLSGSSIAVTFNTPFNTAPVCWCSHVAAVPIACGPTAAASQSAVTFAVPAGSGNINWECIGKR